MRLLFFGTADIARPVLRALVAAGHEIAAIVTQPDRPRGRSGKPEPPPVKEEALALGLAAPILQPEKLKTRQAREAIEALGPFDAGIVVAYGQLISRRILDVPARGCLNVHASLLPRWRGAAPVQRAIEAGDPETGVAIMRVTERLDAGAVLALARTPIGPDDTSEALLRRLGDMGAALLVETLARWQRGEAVPEAAQDEALATHAAPIDKREGEVDWTLPPAAIAAKLRAFTPWPGIFSHLHRATAGGAPQRIELTQVRALPLDPRHASLAPGAIIGEADGALLVRAGSGRSEGVFGLEGAADGRSPRSSEGLLAILRLKPAGKRDMAAIEWLRGRGTASGDRFGAVAGDPQATRGAAPGAD